MARKANFAVSATLEDLASKALEGLDSAASKVAASVNRLGAQAKTSFTEMNQAFELGKNVFEGLSKGAELVGRAISGLVTGTAELAAATVKAGAATEALAKSYDKAAVSGEAARKSFLEAAGASSGLDSILQGFSTSAKEFQTLFSSEEFKLAIDATVRYLAGSIAGMGNALLGVIKLARSIKQDLAPGETKWLEPPKEGRWTKFWNELTSGKSFADRVSQDFERVNARLAEPPEDKLWTSSIEAIEQALNRLQATSLGVASTLEGSKRASEDALKAAAKASAGRLAVETKEADALAALWAKSDADATQAAVTRARGLAQAQAEYVQSIRAGRTAIAAMNAEMARNNAGNAETLAWEQEQEQTKKRLDDLKSYKDSLKDVGSTVRSALVDPLIDAAFAGANFEETLKQILKSLALIALKRVAEKAVDGIFSIFSSAGSGAAAGSAAGPYGALVGAAVGAGVGIAQAASGLEAGPVAQSQGMTRGSGDIHLYGQFLVPPTSGELDRHIRDGLTPSLKRIQKWGL